MVELILDSDFSNMFNIYFKGLDKDQIVKKIETGMKDYRYYRMNDLLNVVKVAHASGMTFSEYRDIIAESLSSSEEDMDWSSTAVVVGYLISICSKQIESFINEHTKKVNKDAKVATEQYSIIDEPVSSWDEYFFNVCRQVARNSKCLSRRIGAVLIKDKSIISTGYNGPPRGIPQCNRRWTIDNKFNDKYKSKIIGDISTKECPRKIIGAKSGEYLEMCVAGHAEENAILNAARMGICTNGTTMALSCGIPCFRCMIKIINAGVSEIIVTNMQLYDDTSEYLLNNSDVKVRMYEF